VTPAIAACVIDWLWEINDVVAMPEKLEIKIAVA
jgi:hypothetical protein